MLFKNVVLLSSIVMKKTVHVRPKFVISPLKRVISLLKCVSSPLKRVSSPLKRVISPLKRVFSQVKCVFVQQGSLNTSLFSLGASIEELLRNNLIIFAVILKPPTNGGKRILWRGLKITSIVHEKKCQHGFQRDQEI